MLEKKLKKAEGESLVLGEPDYKLLVENAIDIITVLAVDGTTVYESPSFGKLFGYKQLEVNGKNIFSFIHLEDVVRVKEKFAKALADPSSSQSVEFRFRHKNGSWLILESIGRVAVEASGEKRVIVNSRDVTERKKAEEKLGESEQRYKALVDAAPLCIKLFDAAGNLVSVNQHGREEHFLIGKSDEEIKKWRYMECIEPAYRNLVVQRMKEALVGKRSEFEFEHVQGTTSVGHWCYSYLTPVADKSGKIDHVLFVSRDISAEKEVAEEGQKNIAQLTKFNDAMIGRELKMVELKKVLRQAQDEIEELKNPQKSEPVNKPE